MAPSSTRAGRGGRTAFVVVAAVAALLAAGLTAGWFYLANEIDRQVTAALAVAKSYGVTLTCANQDVFGYPFRLGLKCEATALDIPSSGLRASTGAFRTAAQIYEPTRIVAELDSPALIETVFLPPLDLRWSLGQASMKIDDGVARTISVSFDQPVISLSQPAADRLPIAEADHLEAHARRRGEDLDLALSNRGTRLIASGRGELPAFDASADMTVDGAADWLGGGLEAATLGAALAGRTGTVRSLMLDFGGAEAEVSGPFSVDGQGRVSGDFELSVAEPEELARVAAGIAPALAPFASSLAAGIGLVGRRVGEHTVIPLRLRNGQASSGFIPLGSLPPLR